MHKESVHNLIVTECLQDSVYSLIFSSSDIGKVIEALYSENPPPVMIIGHSMGGAVAVHTAAANHIPSLLGLCVIDVVEGKCFSHLELTFLSLLNLFLRD